MDTEFIINSNLLIHLDQLPKPSDLFQNKTYVHGLFAYSNNLERNAQLILDYVNNPVGEMQICCTGNGLYIGDIGLYITGCVHFVSSRDISTGKDSSNRRYTDRHTLSLAKSVTEPNDYIDEAILTPKTVQGIWYNANSDEFVTFANSLSKEHNLPLKALDLIGQQYEGDKTKVIKRS
ncbi:hypothetical protein [Paenibacillus polymyxa]|uniref:Uncharacterized protein n=1 Tax=Paenibacillus polymyxa (strain SC2) TaxID=886882 RepID=E3EKG5_PAEPS|nr:hypothetical protein [Paenibacillus polymyxa]ADO59797.1 hypothetical protein PPSC2_26175 [Paenibacillus polymyxa SC2]WPQ59968.1 hypothetical protein SKN87_27380 [Paenibacillus polymyxa]